MTTILGVHTIPYYGVNVLEGRKDIDDDNSKLDDPDDKKEAIDKIKSLNEKL